MTGFGIGAAAKRKEDVRLVTGAGTFVDDISVAGTVHGVVLRSPHAHADIRSIDVAGAMAAPGVLAVYTGADLAVDGIGGLPVAAPAKNKDGTDIKKPPFPALVSDRARHVGDNVAFVVAETRDQARDAAELVVVDYEPRAAVVSADAARQKGAPQVWDDVPNNICFEWETGDRKAVDAAFSNADHVSELRIFNNRLAANAMEPRTYLGQFDGASGRYTLHAASQNAQIVRDQLASAVFKVPAEDIRVVTPDVGGGFGSKNFPYPEMVLVLYAARKLGRPVAWRNDRSEAFVSDDQGRDHLTDCALAFDADGRILALRLMSVCNMGSQCGTTAPLINTVAVAAVTGGVYRIPAIYHDVTGVFTNTVTVGAYRGAGRPEANFVIERLLDKAARERGMTPDAIRRINFVQPDEMPYTAALGMTWDSGEFERTLDDALSHIDAAGFDKRRAASRERGRLRGLGLGYYLEATLGPPNESATVAFDADGFVNVLVGTFSNGQGHETTFAQILADRLGVPFEKIRLVQGDSDVVKTGGGFGGSRSTHLGGAAILGAAAKVIENGRRLAAHVLEAAEADIEFSAGTFTVAGTDRTVGIMDLAARAPGLEGLPAGIEPSLDAMAAYSREASSFPNGCHACEVEVDPETGATDVVRYVVVDDFGRIINPMIVEGQVQGGVAQGLGQALFEDVVYDPESGQLLSGSFMDYCMPRADDLPAVEFHSNEIPCPTNPLGIKGCGEAGTIGATPAVINAVVDALSAHGIDDVPLPATRERLWHAIRGARA
jgi:carbon-monoxide dehydrogenase large subunit